MTAALQLGRSRTGAAVLSALAMTWLLQGCTPSLRANPATPTAAGAEAAAPARLSGYHFMSRSTQALQDEDSQNPAFLWVEDGRKRFEAQCAGCHNAEGGRDKLRDVATRYPAFDTATGKPISLAGRIEQCQSQRVTSAAGGISKEKDKDKDGLLALESFLAHAARGLLIAEPADPRLAPFIKQGQQWWQQRLGQIDLSCADCHDRLAGQRLAGSTIPQAHPTGYPVYRLEWQGLGSLQRRMRGCLVGVRAEPFADGADEWVLLELALKARAAGMTIDAPAVRP